MLQQVSTLEILEDKINVSLDARLQSDEVKCSLQMMNDNYLRVEICHNSIEDKLNAHRICKMVQYYLNLHEKDLPKEAQYLLFKYELIGNDFHKLEYKTNLRYIDYSYKPDFL
ncbi:hypothetical protein [Aureibacter tunicatorum]|uniref:Uncharacterized protein n=1 Tax=Aureibacter tunicatorum TaxID=866807 RepID=A0AAE3XNH8_9BACT|nr:hypothetical protein [Aureibacter tunicatorum]MDR6239823.1 hypothetical protein [Aureibacter tunicatorum]BDD04298.1 hypothetical protein AUTU_17810 [Aureibacter tunicatorum]